MPDGGEERRSYEKVNGPVPRVELFDETGLAQQTSGPSLPPGMPDQIEGAAAMAANDAKMEAEAAAWDPNNPADPDKVTSDAYKARDPATSGTRVQRAGVVRGG